MNHFINTAATDLARARTVGLRNLLPAPFPVLTVGSVSTQAFYFASAGTIESWSGAADYTLRVTIGDVLSGPIGRVYTLTVGNGTAKQIPFDLDAAGLQDVLNRDATITTEGGVEVVEQAVGRFLIAYKVLGAVSAITIDPALLTPDCSASVQVLATGDATTRQLVMITLRRTIPFSSTAFSAISSPYAGWQGQITLDSAAAIELIRLNGKQVGGYLQCETTLTVEVLNASGDPTTYYQTTITLRALNYSVSAASAMTQNFFARPNIVGLVSNSSNATLLGGLTTAAGDYPIGSTVQCLFTGDVVAKFVRKATTANQSWPFIIRPYDYNVNTNPYQWSLDSVTRYGVPTVWNADTNAFHYEVAAGNANSVALAVDQTGIQLPA